MVVAIESFEFNGGLTTFVANSDSVILDPLNDDLEVLAKGELLALPYVDPRFDDGLNDELEVLAK
eukprot:929106-Amphidinium_carterae.1